MRKMMIVVLGSLTLLQACARNYNPVVDSKGMTGAYSESRASEITDDIEPFWALEQVFFEAIKVLREVQSKRTHRTRLRFNWMHFYIHNPIALVESEPIQTRVIPSGYLVVIFVISPITTPQVLLPIGRSTGTIS